MCIEVKCGTGEVNNFVLRINIYGDTNWKEGI